MSCNICPRTRRPTSCIQCRRSTTQTDRHTYTKHDMRCTKTDACFFLVFLPISRKCYWFFFSSYFIGLQALTIPTVHLIDFKLAIFFCLDCCCCCFCWLRAFFPRIGYRFTDTSINHSIICLFTHKNVNTKS